jgi:hypothetical protein
LEWGCEWTLVWRWRVECGTKDTSTPRFRVV